jgi:chemotaxis protein methyltransferase CheR
MGGCDGYGDDPVEGGPMITSPTAPLSLGISPQIPMTDPEFRLLRTLIYELTGIYFQDTKKYLLEGRLGKRLKILNLKNFQHYHDYFRSPSGRSQELKHLYDAITINETYFFRNEPQFEAFERTIVPEIMNAQRTNGRSKLRVWSAASSSGEEAYTLAMIYLEKLRPRFPRLDIEIYGSDINSGVLANAQSGLYREYSVRNMPKTYLEKYFVVQEGRYQLRDEVRRLARFNMLNLSDRGQMRTMSQFDVVFCCNVLIYFDTKSKMQVVNGLYDSMKSGGYLFIGPAESLHGISTAFKLSSFPKTVAYKRV